MASLMADSTAEAKSAFATSAAQLTKSKATLRCATTCAAIDLPPSFLCSPS
eukprot:CAMPEP_0194500638 /NCGR_PEP_ID=MMETSP0253-20130528/18934_1 /TAXON_ID=2966 /ORGANISM="Noctiluca scintillans" /LENGTH=50 /DNA_ID=CAMNT_0039342497 /DNA_START=30 /DNA_END=178 /DNA_ORIENTATION=+